MSARIPLALAALLLVAGCLQLAPERDAPISRFVTVELAGPHLGFEAPEGSVHRLVVGPGDFLVRDAERSILVSPALPSNASAGLAVQVRDGSGYGFLVITEEMHRQDFPIVGTNSTFHLVPRAAGGFRLNLFPEPGSVPPEDCRAHVEGGEPDEVAGPSWDVEWNTTHVNITMVHEGEASTEGPPCPQGRLSAELRTGWTLETG